MNWEMLRHIPKARFILKTLTVSNDARADILPLVLFSYTQRSRASITFTDGHRILFHKRKTLLNFIFFNPWNRSALAVTILLSIYRINCMGHDLFLNRGGCRHGGGSSVNLNLEHCNVKEIFVCPKKTRPCVAWCFKHCYFVKLSVLWKVFSYLLHVWLP